jgi:small subunit ribosomal protein S20
MANIRSQQKRIHRTERERLENRNRTSTVKTYFRRLERAVESGDQSAIDGEFRALVSRIFKAA